jgi:5-methylcytosine-specific restriction protein B
MVGHSYFLAENSVDLDMKWQYEILPLIQEYYKDGIIKTEPKQVSIQEFIDPVE